MGHVSIYERARDEAVAAAVSAGELINHRAGDLLDGEVREKGAHDLVTVLDEQVQDMLVSRLSAAFPDHAFLAEEGELSSGEIEVDGFRWIIDPIDGTTNFSRGAPPYAVSIGLQHEDRVVVGVILEPSRNEMYTAIRGEGLLLNGRPLGVSHTKTLEEAIVATGFPYRAITHLEPFLEVLSTFIQRCHGFRRLGSAATDLAYVAAGRFDGFYEIGLSPWDMAAGSLLVEEGGGVVTAFDGSPHSLFSNEIVATNGLLHDEILEIIAPLNARTLVRRRQNENVDNS